MNTMEETAPAQAEEEEPCLSVVVKQKDGTAATTTRIPQLAFGCYKVPNNEQGEIILQNALEVGYRHFDTATYYENEATLGRVLSKSGIPRSDFYLVSKVWNDVQKLGRQAVRQSVLQSIKTLNFGKYWDLFLIHWPVPDCYVETYKELELLQQEGHIRAIGLSNFSFVEYKTLLPHLTIPPILNQFEVSPFMYRPVDVDFFQKEANLIVSASKAMYRGGAQTNETIQTIAKAHNVTAGQIMIRWSLQKNFIVLTMSSSKQHQQENRQVTHFVLSNDEMKQLDSLTTSQAIEERTALELERKKSM